MIKGIVKKGEYFDSVSLMLVAKDVNNMEGINDSGVVMGTEENKNILIASGLFPKEFEDADDTDLLIVVEAESEEFISQAFSKVDELFKNLRSKSDDEESVIIPKSFDKAVEQMEDANISLISIAGKYAYAEAMKALEKGLHVMLFSDNVTIEEEIKLKTFALERNLLVMGPDCGTAIINGIPLAFANVVKRGPIGIVAASGTGLQEVSCVISNEGGGISQAIGTGGRDVKNDVGGMMFLSALEALKNDSDTKVIVLVSKPPDADVQLKIANAIKSVDKPVVAIMIGGNPEILSNAGAIPASTLEEAGVLAISQMKGINPVQVLELVKGRNAKIIEQGIKISQSCKGKYVRGLFSGGTLCDETQLIFKELIGFTYSNTPLNPTYKLDDLWKSKENTIIDLGEDEFTAGRPHPMIDFSLRCKRIVEEAKDPETAIILLDVVLGYGSNLDPAGELIPAIKEALSISPDLKFVASITGTDQDPQNKTETKKRLEEAGVIVMSSNAEASILTGIMIKRLGGK
jgi:succinyl-CoA synthetase alpha subunit